MKKKILAILALTFGMSSLAHAGILLEPYVGYETGDVKFTYLNSTSGTDKLSGSAFGLRLGYKFLLPWVALDYSTGTGKAKFESGSDQNYTKTSLGVSIGADLPIIHPFVGYGISNDLTYKGNDGAADTKFKGTYVKAGVGLGFIPFVNVNIEYKINTFDKVDTGTGEVDKSTVYSDLKHDSLMLSLSLPLNL